MVPKHFFVRKIIEERKPLAASARRAGWIGCNILLRQIPTAGKIFFVRDGKLQSKDIVLAQWQNTLFLRDESFEARGWLIEVMKCIELLGKAEFEIDDVYAFENRLSQLYPNNRHINKKFVNSFSSSVTVDISTSFLGDPIVYDKPSDRKLMGRSYGLVPQLLQMRTLRLRLARRMVLHV